jgi:dihydroorotate dehydrogenase
VYRVLFNLVLQRLDPERAHTVAHFLIRIMGQFSPARALVRTVVGAGRSVHPVRLFHRTLPGPVGLAAGFDKNATAVRGLATLGFSFVEVGTVTRFPQPGNPPPRLWRLVEQQALRNAMGFNNPGADQVAATLRRLRAQPGGWDVMVGVNIGKSKITPAEEAPGDYYASASRLARYADYLVVNVSSPNTPGLRDLQATRALKPILEAARLGAKNSLEGTGRRDPVPLLVKIAPDLADSEVDAVAHLVDQLDLDGVVAVNTTIAHDFPGGGGISGPPLLARGLEVVARLRRQLGPDKTILGVGGIGHPEDVAAYLTAGADAVQAYTAFIYQGPSWPASIQDIRRV